MLYNVPTIECPTCHSEGVVEQLGSLRARICHQCKGTGEIDDECITHGVVAVGGWCPDCAVLIYDEPPL